MSIATEIQRIKIAKENIINTLKANDIAIEETATIDELEVVMNEVPILDTSDATATAEDIALGKTAYVNGEKIEGILEAMGDYNATVNISIPEGIASKSGILLAIKKVVGVSSGASARYLFYNCSALEELEFDAKNVTNTGSNLYNFCGNCTSLKIVSMKNTNHIGDFSGAFLGCSSLETTPNVDTSSGARFNSMYRNCTNLKNVIPFNINTYGDGSAAVHQNLFSGCTNLSDEALNNILLMCTNAPLAPVKSLSHLGLTSAQTTRCQSLSNYQAFLDAGWTV